MANLLPDFWYVVIGFLLFLALSQDGYALGIGILSLFTRSEAKRDIYMGSIAGFWHSNLTWLVVMGGLLFASFPLAYALILSALYIPLIVALFGNAVRGVAIDYWEEHPDKFRWGLPFGLGSLFAALAQGFVLGGYLAGLPVQNNEFTGGVWSWLNPFASVVALAVLCAYVLLGATWLILKTEGDILQESFRSAQIGAWIFFIVAVALSVWSYIRYPNLASKWFTWPDFWYTLLPLLLAAVSIVGLNLSLYRRWETAPFFISMAMVFFTAFAVAGTIHPYVVPPSLTIPQAASSVDTLIIMFFYVIIILPVMLLYNGYNAVVFRGKTRGEHGSKE